MDKIDLTKGEWRNLYKATVKPQLLTVAKRRFLAVEGQGDPNSSAFQQAVEALYSVAYTLKFMIKKGATALEPIDYKVAPLEAQWYADDMTSFATGKRDQWRWVAMIATPDFITSKLVAGAIDAAKKKKPLAKLDDVKLIKDADGLAAQIMHIGPYSTEAATVERLHNFIKDSGCKLSGRHREIYLGDPRRTAPEKLKTIIRQPCRR